MVSLFYGSAMRCGTIPTFKVLINSSFKLSKDQQPKAISELPTSNRRLESVAQRPSRYQ